MINEDLRKWVAEKWVDIGAPKKGGGFKPCGRSKGEKRKGYPKCVPSAKASAMSKGQRQSAVKRKRAAGNTGPKPTNVPTFARKNESMDIYEQIIHIINEMHVKKAERKAMALYKKQPEASDTSAPASLLRLQYRKALSDVEAAKKKRRARLAAKGMTEKDAEDKGVKERYKKKIIPKKPDNVVDSIQRIGNLITEADKWKERADKWKERGAKLAKIALAAPLVVKGVNDRYIRPYGQSDNIRYDLKNPVPETKWERQRRSIQGNDYVDDWDIQALRKGRNKLGTRNFDQDLVWGAHDLVTGRDRKKELETREKLKPALFAQNKAVMRSLATRGIKANPTPRSGINPQMLYQKEQTELTKSFDRINNLITEVAAWQRKEGKNPSGGLNKAGVMSYRRENPGSKLKTAVTTKPSKLKKGSKAAKRRKSFCARMSGLKSKLTSKKTASNPDSRINKALRKWNC